MVAPLRHRFAFLTRPSGTIEVGRGIRTFLAMVIPYVGGQIIGYGYMGLAIALFAQMILLADGGGLYSLRLKTLLAAWLGTAIAVGLGVMARGDTSMILVFTGIILFVAGYLTVYGEQGALVGIVTGFAWLVGLANTNNLVFNAVAVLLGGLWSVGLAMVIWPFRPNQPLRRAVAKNFEHLAGYLGALAQIQREQAAPPAVNRLESALGNLRSGLLASRQGIAETRRGIWGQSRLRELLIVLIEQGERLSKTLMLLEEIVNFHQLPQLQTTTILMGDMFETLGDISQGIARMIGGKRQVPDLNRLRSLITALQQQQQLQRQTLTGDLADYTSLTTVSQLNRHLETLETQIQETLQIAQLLAEPGRSPAPETVEIPWLAMETAPWWEPLTLNFSLASPLCRHGLRLSLGGMVGTLIADWAQIPFGYWIVLTLIFVLKPDFSLTFQRLCNRLLGTVFGIMLVSLLFPNLSNPQLLAWLAMASMAIAMAFLRFHYSVAVFFITAFALFLSALSPPIAANPLLIRLLCTLIGSGLAFLVAFGLGRQSEEKRFAQASAQVIAALQTYFQWLIPALVDSKPLAGKELEAARCHYRLKIATVQANLERLLNDPRTPLAAQEPAITLTHYISRLGRGVRALVSHLEKRSASESPPPLGAFADQVMASLQMLRVALENQSPPLPLPPLGQTLGELQAFHRTHQTQRLSEIQQQQHQTRTYFYLQDFNLVVAECREINQRLDSLQRAIARFAAAKNEGMPGPIPVPNVGGGKSETEHGQ